MEDCDSCCEPVMATIVGSPFVVYDNEAVYSVSGDVVIGGDGVVVVAQESAIAEVSYVVTTMAGDIVMAKGA